MTASISVAPVASTSPNTSPNPSRLNAYWQWWTNELRALVPPRLMNWVVGDVAVTDLMVDASGITLVRIESGTPIAVARISLAEVSTHPPLRELRAKGHDQARVLLGADQVLLKSISLPAAIEENLREVMGFELDRYTPFVSSQVYYDVKLQKREPQRESIQVLLAVAARAVVDPLLATVRLAGLSVDSITVTGVDTAGQTIELLPASDKLARKWGNLLKLNLALLGVVLLLALAAMLLPIWQKREAVIALNPLVGKASADYEVSQRVHAEYTKLANEFNFINGKKHSMYPSLTILEEMTRISPDTTVVQSLDLKSTGKNREVTLIGEAQAASRVIEALEQSPMFQNASSRSPTRRGSLATNEWFHVATELKPKPMPVATILGEKPPEAPVVPPSATVVPPVSVNTNASANANAAAPAAAEPSGKAVTGSQPAGTVPATSDATTGKPVPSPGGQSAAPDEAAATPSATRKLP